MQAGFEVINAGILTLLQDRGRFGFNALGVTQSGVMDEFAYFWANKLLQNDLNTNVLEILWSNLTLKATTPCVISVTGANLTLSINDKVYEPWQTFNIHSGDIIKFSKTIHGQRAYLSVKGGFLFHKEFDSFSTTLKETLGIFDGRALKRGDFLPCKSSRHIHTRRLKKHHQPNYHEPLRLRVLLGYQEEYFSNNAKKRFFSQSYMVSNENNRMGIKLKGEKIECDIDGIISEGISFGAIQVPKDGQPIVLLKDRQTIGGYPKIGSVLSIDCFKLSQIKPNTMIQFEEISLLQAQEKLRKFYSSFKE